MAQDADVIVVGAGPAGSATAYYLALHGLHVILLEKATFPRDKTCGDGLTPRAVGELIRMGISLREEDGWVRNYGVRAYGGGHCIEVPWPELCSMPSWGTARRRIDLDHMLAQHAVAAGAHLREGVHVCAPLYDERSGRVIGVEAQERNSLAEVPVAGSRQDVPRSQYRARFVVDAGGVAARLATSCGRTKKMNRPMGVAVRTYFESPLAQTDMMESQLELWAGEPGRSEQLPGYAWMFAVGDGLVNVGLGSLSATAKASGINHKNVLQQWLAHTPEEWGLTAENQRGPIQGAALPMAFNRTPHYANGLALVGDAGGMVSPFNGEGIAYALVSGRLLADSIVQAMSRPSVREQDRAMEQYPMLMRDELGGYYTLGRIFAKLIENPAVMHICVKYGLPRPALMKLVMKLLSDSYDRHGGDWMDRFITTLTKVVPRA
ncbi:geranylgeranyl reductase family protein [Trueperella sp. LYQ143]|uniref:geranylgeranyl reductase family protein n=1 Tax=unclassified Trueperella TaxID=2630174 RepID=UPI0039836DF8